MKKTLIYLFFFICICFIIPALLTKRETKTSSSSTINEIKIEENANNITNTTENNQDTNDNNRNEEDNLKIKLLHKKTGEVEEIDIEKYICNVVSAEMPADYEIEALKAQAVIARTYTIYKMKNKKHDNADICDDSTCCQAWISKEDRLSRWEEDKKESNWKKIEQCVNETEGKIVTYQGAPINAFFHSNSGGTTEIPVNVWGGTDYPYLQVVETAGEEGYEQYNSEVILSNEDLINKLKTKYSDIQIDFQNQDEIKILEYTESKRVKTVKFGNHNLSGVETRTLLGLKSTNFEITKEDNNIKFTVKGYGHGVGMSQTGANTMAKEGKNYEEIIKHFYIGIEVEPYLDIS